MEYQYLTIDRDGHILLIGLNRAQKRNAMHEAMLQELALAYRELHDDPDLRVGVVYAHGEHFSAGLDLTDIGPKMADGSFDALAGGIDPWGIRTEPVSKPVIVALQGYAYTLSIELALAADIVVAAESTTFAQLEVARGIMPFGGATLRFHRLGWGNAMRRILTAEPFDTREAHRIGLVQEITPDGEQLATAIEIAAQIARNAPLAVQAALASSRDSLIDSESTRQSLDATATKLAATKDAARAVESYLRGEPVAFEGD
ncbi:crotonase/enoyl-CoA hydratase family protein [uncultured Agrococcus sp.]|uniref:crotonase/enoyl-CoA hydratase family protein n=1 Tax=uncultured Agrococcus sp. TaxID=382258 RepID=UPI0025E9AF42|nr:crotonase/enoyl-CoA hydratase family protein [uncultured Agrococcus sp.]